MRKSLPAAAFISILLVAAIAGTILVNLATASPIGTPPEPTQPSIAILSPEIGKTYNVSTISLTFTVGGLLSLATIYSPYALVSPRISSIEYFIDGEWSELDREVREDSQPFEVTLTSLSDGEHEMKVRATATWSGYNAFGPVSVELTGYSITLPFTVDTIPPSISSVSLQDKNGGTTATKILNFRVSEQISWIGYSLDGKAPVTITEDTVVTPSSLGRYDCYAILSGLPDGEHLLTLQVRDLADHISESISVSFDTDQDGQSQSNTEQHSEPFPTLEIITVAVILVAIISAGFIYFKKRKR